MFQPQKKKKKKLKEIFFTYQTRGYSFLFVYEIKINSLYK